MLTRTSWYVTCIHRLHKTRVPSLFHNNVRQNNNKNFQNRKQLRKSFFPAITLLDHNNSCLRIRVRIFLQVSIYFDNRYPASIHRFRSWDQRPGATSKPLNFTAKPRVYYNRLVAGIRFSWNGRSLQIDSTKIWWWYIIIGNTGLIRLP